MTSPLSIKSIRVSTSVGASPAAVIENGTRTGQRVITGTLDTLSDKSAAADTKSPALIIVGSVVTLQDKLSWFSDTGE